MGVEGGLLIMGAQAVGRESSIAMQRDFGEMDINKPLLETL